MNISIFKIQGINNLITTPYLYILVSGETLNMASVPYSQLFAVIRPCHRKHLFICFNLESLVKCNRSGFTIVQKLLKASKRQPSAG